MSYIIGSFNIKKLNFATKYEDADDKSVRRDYDTIGRIIMENFDVVALQEIQTKSALELCFPANSGWMFCWAPARSKMDEGDEGYAFAWNTKRLRLVAEPEIWRQYKQELSLGAYGLFRNPYYARFTPSETECGGPFCEIRLVTTHIRFSPQNNKLLNASAIVLRQKEYDVLVRQILNRITCRRYGNNMPAYSFLLGDYNLNINENGNPSPYLEQIVYVDDGNITQKFITVQSDKTTISRKKIGDKIYEYNGFANNYDHYTYCETLFDKQGGKIKSKSINSVVLYKNGDYEKHFHEISDHIPIALCLELK